jgi:hypothetical protein
MTPPRLKPGRFRAPDKLLAMLSTAGRKPSKYPPAEPGALVLEPLEAACPCSFSSAALLR